MAQTHTYRVHQPKPLISLATGALATWIASQPNRLLSPTLELHRTDPKKAEELISRQIEGSRNYLEHNLPGKLHDLLALEVIEKMLIEVQKLRYFGWKHNKNVTTELKIIGRMIEILFTANLTTLSFHNVSQTCFMKALKDTFSAKSYLLTGLTRLNLRGRFCIEETDLIMFLKELHNLKHLSIEDCSHNVVKCIAKNCKLIEELKSFRDDKITEKSIDKLKQLPHLRIVSLMQSTINQKGIETLLLYEKFTEIKVSMAPLDEYCNVDLSLEHIASQYTHAEKHFNLKYYENNLETTLQQLRLVVNMCPLIQEVNLYSNGSINISSLSPLLELQHLRKLKLRQFNFYENQVKEVLQARGFNLVKLHLEDDRQLDLNAFIFISQMCPNLESLYLKNCDYRLGNQSADIDLSLKLDNMPFKKLERLSLEGLIGAQEMSFLLMTCLNVKFINVNNSRHSITDVFMFKVLKHNPLINLQELKMVSKVVSRVDNLNDVQNEQTKPALLFIDNIVQNRINPPEINISNSVLLIYE